MTRSAPSEQGSAAVSAALLPITRSYAVVWSSGGEVGSGRLDPFPDRLELCGREPTFSIAFSELLGAVIARSKGDRLRGLPVLVLRGRGGTSLRIASLEGPGRLHELAQHVERAGLAVAR
jgi:hypothetical protein